MRIPLRNTVLKYRSDLLHNGDSIKFTLQGVQRLSVVVHTCLMRFQLLMIIQDHQEISLHNTEWIYIPTVLIVCNYAIHCNLPQYIETKRCIIFRSIVHYIAIEYETSRLCNTILWLVNCIQEFVNCHTGTLTSSLCVRIWKIRVENLSHLVFLLPWISEMVFLPQLESGIILHAVRLKDIRCLRPGSMSTSVDTVSLCARAYVYQRERSHRKFSDKSWNGL